MLGEKIEVTRWDNESQQYVSVGNLVKAVQEGREHPIIGFQYDKEYLLNFPLLAPSDIETIYGENVVIGSSKHNDYLPTYFKQFLPDEQTKQYMAMADRAVLTLDSFDLLKYVTSFKGSFKAIQFNFDSETQHNMPPSVEDACITLLKLKDAQANGMEEQLLSFTYNLEKRLPSIFALVNIDEELHHCKMSLHENENEVKKLKVIREIATNVGIETPMLFTADIDGNHFSGHITGEAKHSAVEQVSEIHNEIPIACLLETSKRVTSYENNTFAKIADVVTHHCPNVPKSLFLKIALLSNLCLQNHLSPHNLFLREETPGNWNMAPLNITHPDQDLKLTPSISINEVHSAFLPIYFDEYCVKSIAQSFKMGEQVVKEVITEFSEQFKNFIHIAEQNGLGAKDIEMELEQIAKSNIVEFADDIEKEKINEVSPE